MPDIIETVDAIATAATAYSLGVGQFAQGTIGVGGDHDWYAIDLVQGETYTFGLVGTGLSTEHLHDPLLRLYGGGGGDPLVSNDDGGPGLNSTITYTAPVTGTYYLDAASYGVLTTGEYTLSAVSGARADYDAAMAAGALLRSDLAWSAAGTAATVTWGVRTNNPDTTDASGNAAPFSQLTAAQIVAVQTSLDMYSEVANITFTQVNPGSTTNHATMLFSNYTSNTDGAGAYAYLPGSTATTANAGDVYLNTTSVSTTSLPTGRYSFSTVLHEIGHAIGLSHPGDYNAAPGQSITYANSAQYTQDSNQYSIMSYFDESHTTRTYGSNPDTLMLHDIFAMQLQYGANMTTRTGDTTYGFNASDAGSVYDFASNTDPALSIWDAAGDDTLDVSGFAQNQFVSLVAGSFSNIGGLSGNVSIAFGATVENAVGGSGNDTLVGNEVANTLSGGGGNDVLIGNDGADDFDGGSGTDTLDIARSTTSGDNWEIFLTTGAGGSATNLSEGGTGDVSAIENVDAGTGDDLLHGSAENNVFDGGAGDDTIWGYNSVTTWGGTGGLDTAIYDFDFTAGNYVVTYTGGVGIVITSSTGEGVDTVYNVDQFLFNDVSYSWADVWNSGVDANHIPEITSSGAGEAATIGVAENTTAVVTVTATDEDGDDLTYSIIGGDDLAAFIIDADTGVLTFVNAPDFENPGDTNGDNRYDVIIQVSDGVLTDIQSLTVNVTDTGEPATIETNGDHELRTDAAGLYEIHKADSTIIPVTSGGTAVGTGSYTGWQMIQAEDNPDGGYTLLWRHENGNYARWQTDENGERTGGEGVAAIDLVDHETDFETDLDGDGNIGHVETQIENNGDYALLSDTSGNYVVEDGDGARVTLSNGGNAVGPRSYAGWQMLQAEENGDGGFDLLWQHENGHFAIWHTDASGARLGGEAVAASDLVDHETLFETDLDGNEAIGHVETQIENNGDYT